MDATRITNHACHCFLGAMLLTGCEEAAVDSTFAASPEAPSAIDSQGFCDADPGTGSWLENADFCDDFGDGTDTRWEPQGGLWEVTDNEYVGTGVVDVCMESGFSSNETLIRDLRARDVELRVEMRSQQRVDKGIVLRSTSPTDQIELNFRADPFNDLVVQEIAACQFILLEFVAQIPHLVGQTIDVRAKLIGDLLCVWIDGELVLSRRFPFQATSGSMGLAAIRHGGVTAFDNVQVDVLN